VVMLMTHPAATQQLRPHVATVRPPTRRCGRHAPRVRQAGRHSACGLGCVSPGMVGPCRVL
jgi:hypothetical protein